MAYTTGTAPDFAPALLSAPSLWSRFKASVERSAMKQSRAEAVRQMHAMTDLDLDQIGISRKHIERYVYRYIIGL